VRACGWVRGAPSLYLGVHQGGQREVVKQVGEGLPHIGIAVLPQALVIEAVHLRDLSALVVPAQDCDALAVADLRWESNVENAFQVTYCV